MRGRGIGPLPRPSRAKCARRGWTATVVQSGWIRPGRQQRVPHPRPFPHKLHGGRENPSSAAQTVIPSEAPARTLPCRGTLAPTEESTRPRHVLRRSTPAPGPRSSDASAMRRIRCGSSRLPGPGGGERRTARRMGCARRGRRFRMIGINRRPQCRRRAGIEQARRPPVRGDGAGPADQWLARTMLDSAFSTAWHRSMACSRTSYSSFQRITSTGSGDPAKRASTALS